MSEHRHYHHHPWGQGHEHEHDHAGYGGHGGYGHHADAPFGKPAKVIEMPDPVLIGQLRESIEKVKKEKAK